MKKTLRSVCLLLLPVMVLLSLAGWSVFLLPPQYQQTFLGALRQKTDLLEASGTRPRIIVIGGSSVAFGQRSDLLEAELPGYDVVNFGLFAGLGTDVMLDLALPDIRRGDVVLISPEQNAQTLSGFFGAEAMWQAADGRFDLLFRVRGAHAAQLLAGASTFAVRKYKLWQSGRMPEGDGVYRRDSFNAWGDVAAEEREHNTMPGGYDPNMMICFEPTMLQDEFVSRLNAFAEACRGKGASVFYRFCPMNALAISAEEAAKQVAYEEKLKSALHFPLLGAAQDSVMDAAWFFDTNFHLNASGAVVNTAIMAAQLKKALDLPGQVSIPLPEKPQTMALNLADDSISDDESWFTLEQRSDGVYITGLTDAGAMQTVLTIPAQIHGQPVIAFAASTFADNPYVVEIELPDSIRRIDDGSFAQCAALERVVLSQENPSQVTVGNGLLKGTDCFVMVPLDAYSQYQTNYFWSVYSARIRPLQEESVQSVITPQPVHADSPKMYVDANGGEAIQTEKRIAFAISQTHLRTNTPMGQKLFVREGYAPLCWNTKPDGTGQDIAFGSRVDSAESMVLYMKWVTETPTDELQWQTDGENVTITGWTGKGTCLVIPSSIHGQPVTAIADHALEHASAEMLVLPPTMRTIGERAFAESAVKTLWLYDSLTTMAKNSLDGCAELTTLQMGADTAPRYAISYYASFADKMDWLRSHQHQQKIILAGGSASRYAYHSERIKQAFPAYEPINMGVYAYTNILPQYRLMQCFAGAGDVLLSAPEFDAAEMQFCVSNALDASFWAMMEADYGNVALLDLRQYSHVGGSLNAYLRNRAAMLPRSWEDTPKRFDDDGHSVPYDTYNQYGDYTLSRGGAERDELLQHVRADYTADAFPREMIESLNQVYREFETQGVQVFFTYAPRNHSALTDASTPAQREQLHRWLTDSLCVPMLIDLEESLYAGQYFYLIDNHLSDEGVYLHTQKIIQALREAGLHDDNHTE